MGHTNETVNYQLPQFIGTDKPSWLGDVNNAFLAIDTAIAAAKTEADSAAGGVAGLQVTVGSHTTQLETLTGTVTSQGGTLNTITSLIGNGQPTTTDKTLIGGINELNAKEGNLADLQTTDKSSLVAAINELTSGGGTVYTVTGDGTKTYGQALTELYAHIGEIKKDSTLVIKASGAEKILKCGTLSSSNAEFNVGSFRTSGVYGWNANITSPASYVVMAAGTGTDNTSNTIDSDGYVKLYI